MECPACRNAFVEWVRASAEACVPCASTRHDKYVYRARVLYPFRSVILRSEIRAFAYSRKDSFFPAHAPDARSAGPRPAGRGFVRRFNWRNRNGSTGIGCASVTHIAIFCSPLFALDLPRNVRGFFFSFDWNEEVVGESRRVYGIVGVSSRCRRIRGFPSSPSETRRVHEYVQIRREKFPAVFRSARARREASFAVRNNERRRKNGFGACERWRRDLGGNVGLLYIRIFVSFCLFFLLYS